MLLQRCYYNQFNHLKSMLHFLHSGSGIEVVGNLYGSGQDGGPILLDQVNCTGGERTLADCRSRGWGRHMCDHSQDVSIHCGPTRK